MVYLAKVEMSAAPESVGGDEIIEVQPPAKRQKLDYSVEEVNKGRRTQLLMEMGIIEDRMSVDKVRMAALVRLLKEVDSEK
jgi:hypothetical protein